MVRVLVATSFQLCSLSASTLTDSGASSCGSKCLGFLSRIFCCGGSVKVDVEEPIRVPTSATSNLEVAVSRESIASETRVTSLKVVEDTLKKLGNLIESGDFVRCSDLVNVIADQLVLGFSNATVEERGYLHDINHFLSDMAYAVQDDLASTELRSSIESNFSSLRALILKISTSSYSGLKVTALEHESSLDKFTASKCENILDVANLAILLTSPIARRHNVGKIEFESDPDMHLEKFKFFSQDYSLNVCRVIYNLLNNAINYIDLARKPNISLGLNVFKKLTKWHASFSVTDNGVGMSSDVLEELFKLHFRAAATSNISGSGVGLNSCKNLVESMGGEIKVISETGKGTTFCFDIPVKTEELIPIEKSEMRLLVVDDSKVIRKFLGNFCERFGLKNVSYAESGEKAIEKYEEALKNGGGFKYGVPYDLIFLDESMPPGMSGSEVARKIRAISGDRPIIFSISGDPFSDTFKAARMNGCLHKPFFFPKFEGLLGGYFDFSDSSPVFERLNRAALAATKKTRVEKKSPQIMPKDEIFPGLPGSSDHMLDG